jgi:hypothetical protein
VEEIEELVPLRVYVDSISRDGLVKIQFNQDTIVPDFINQATNERSLSSLESINVNSIANFIFVVKSDIEPSDLQYFLTLEQWSERDMWIRINFTEPLYVSKGKYNDAVIIDFKTPQLIRTKVGGKTLKSIMITQDILTQVPLGVDAIAMVEKTI